MNVNTTGKGKKWKSYVPPEDDFGRYALSQVGTVADLEMEGQYESFPGTMVLFREWQYSREDIIKFIRGTSQKVVVNKNESEEEELTDNVTIHWMGQQYMKLREMLTSVHWTTQMTDNTIIKEEETFAYARQYFIQAIFWTPLSFSLLRRSIDEGEYPRFRDWYDLSVEFIKRNPQVCKLHIQRRVPGFSHTLEYLLKAYLKVMTVDYQELED